MNKEKTTMIWIGQKKCSKEKLQTPHKLNWGDTDFSILGLEFSVDIPKIPELNFNKAYHSIIMETKKWECRNLSIFGKVTVNISPFKTCSPFNIIACIRIFF